MKEIVTLMHLSNAALGVYILIRVFTPAANIETTGILWAIYAAHSVGMRIYESKRTRKK